MYCYYILVFYFSGVSLEDFVICMKDKLTKVDEDEEIRHTFMAFDMQCKHFLHFLSYIYLEYLTFPKQTFILCGSIHTSTKLWDLATTKSQISPQSNQGSPWSLSSLINLEGIGE